MRILRFSTSIKPFCANFERVQLTVSSFKLRKLPICAGDLRSTHSDCDTPRACRRSIRLISTLPSAHLRAHGSATRSKKTFVCLTAAHDRNAFPPCLDCAAHGLGRWPALRGHVRRSVCWPGPSRRGAQKSGALLVAGRACCGLFGAWWFGGGLGAGPRLAYRALCDTTPALEPFARGCVRPGRAAVAPCAAARLVGATGPKALAACPPFGCAQWRGTIGTGHPVGLAAMRFVVLRAYGGGLGGLGSGWGHGDGIVCPRHRRLYGGWALALVTAGWRACPRSKRKPGRAAGRRSAGRQCRVGLVDGVGRPHCALVRGLAFAHNRSAGSQSLRVIRSEPNAIGLAVQSCGRATFAIAQSSDRLSTVTLLKWASISPRAIRSANARLTVSVFSPR